MRNILVLLLIVTVGIIPLQVLACGKNKVHSLKMERTPCMGKCPWYTIEILANGVVKYWGKKDAPRTGYYEGKIHVDVAKALLKKFSKKRIRKAQDEYQANISDVPMIHYQFVVGKDMETKKVRQANFGPSYFSELSKEVDMALAKVNWVKESDNDNE